MKKGVILGFAAGVLLPVFSAVNVDVLIAYDASAVNWLAANPGNGDINAFAQKQVERWNTVLANTGLTDAFSFRLVGTIDVAYDGSTTAVASIDNVLDSIIDNHGNVVATGELKRIVDKREECGADIVSLLVDRGATGQVGTGWALQTGPGLIPLQDFGKMAYSVCSIAAAYNDYTQLHEIGHNMGCGHPRNLAGIPGPQYTDYAAGMYFTSNGEKYYTVMGYNDDGYGSHYKPYPAFSAPLLTSDGVAIGDANNDNSRVLRENCVAVSNWRAEKISGNNTDDSSSSQGNPVTPSEVVGVFEPEKAAVWTAALYNGDQIAGMIELKIGKMKKGKAKVSGSVVGLDGKKYSMKAVNVETGAQPTIDVEFKKLGTGSLKLGANGFAGKVNGCTVVKAVVGGSIFKSGAKFAFVDALPGSIDGNPVVAELLPNGEPVEMAGGKWVLAKAASIKLVKGESGNVLMLQVNNGKNDPKKTNLSGLKLTYSAKNGVFKGSFTAYSVKGGTKLVKTKFTVNGFMVDGVAAGVATVKGQTPLAIVIK